ncbi:FAD-binding domain-containing protein [Saccharata proteae CBS 121410]|uniref:Delta(24)-sterol reductase n=1 Tax=Saccharata proteae CBS 121410 TaxID=1314787 RepID=A0A9P4HZS5_9PEZI|nr:FAD-binding domain-containing protein [Saccharata proteae CBS 121410]
MDQHHAAVKAISSEVQIFYNNKEPFRIYHGSTNSTRIVHFDRNKMIDMSNFSHVLSVDKERKVALVEPNVPMDDLVNETLKYGLVPPVVMEFPGITVGGGFSGVAGESSSWRWGFFDRIVNWCDVVLPTGQITRASPTENADLFYGAPGTYGTLCVTTLFELQLIPAKKYVELEYVTVETVPTAISTIQSAMAASKHDFIDGILFSATHGAIMLGTMTDEPSSPAIKICRFSRPWDNWFYLHASSVSKPARHSNTPTPKPSHTELVPLTDYLFRYDRGAFWTGRYAFHRFHTPFDRLSRLLLDPLMHTRRMYAALNASGFTQQYIIQDLALPFHSAESFLNWVDAETGIYPLWLCPLRLEGEDADGASPTTITTTTPNGTTDPFPLSPNPTFLLNVGVWGPGPLTHDPFITLNRRLESTVRDLGGFKWLYANAYYTEEEFWEIYDREWYEGLRERYQAGWLLSVFEKVRAKEERVGISGVRGVWTAMRAGGKGGRGGGWLFGKGK